jgi:hypothetical protein
MSQLLKHRVKSRAGLVLILVLSNIQLSLLKAQTLEQEIIVQLEPGTDINQVLTSSNSQRRQNPFLIGESRSLNSALDIFLVKCTKDTPRQEIVQNLIRQTGVKYVQPNHRLKYRSKTPNDPLFKQQWNLIKIGLEDVWQETTGGLNYYGDTIVIGVLEAGLDIDHEDLSSILWVNRLEIPNNNFDDDKNGYIDDYLGVSLDHGKDNHQEDDRSHGTSVLGVLGAQGNNNVGVTGINWQVKVALVSGKTQSTAEAILAYTYFIDLRTRYNNTQGREGAYIVTTNSSFGMEGLFESDAPIFCEMFNAMGAVGILNVGAAENDQGNADKFGDIPANCSSDDLIVVTNVDQDDMLAVAGFGKTTVDLAAPGQMILSTANNNSYAQVSGTAFAAPLVAGGIALLHSHPSQDFADFVANDPQQANQLLKTLILDNVTYAKDLKGKVLTEGRFNLKQTHEALSALYPIDATSSILVTSPNPVVQNTTIHFGEPVSKFKLELFDVSGRKILERDPPNYFSSSYTIDVAGLPSGIYFVVVHLPDEKLKGRLIKF